MKHTKKQAGLAVGAFLIDGYRRRIADEQKITPQQGMQNIMRSCTALLTHWFNTSASHETPETEAKLKQLLTELRDHINVALGFCERQQQDR